jgi:hypothetical protein
MNRSFDLDFRPRICGVKRGCNNCPALLIDSVIRRAGYKLVCSRYELFLLASSVVPKRDQQRFDVSRRTRLKRAGSFVQSCWRLPQVYLSHPGESAQELEFPGWF